MPDTQFYDDLIMDHIKNARNYRALDEASRVAKGMNPLCGDEVQVYVKLDGDIIRDVGFQCSCCGISMASASIMSEAITDARIEDALELQRRFMESARAPAESAEQDPARLALLDTVQRFPARLRCALLPWVTLEAVLKGEVDSPVLVR
jgi:nitrogen fixation NifU-like protein